MQAMLRRDTHCRMWLKIDAAPFGRDLELAVIEKGEVHWREWLD